MAPIRVLWLTKGLGSGGAENLLAAMARAADRDRVAYEAAYLLPWKQALVPTLEAAGVPTHLLEGPREVDPRWATRLRRLLLQGRFDVVHAHSPYPAALARLVVRSLPKRSRPRFVYTQHNEAAAYRRSTRVLSSATFGLDDHRLAVARQVRDSLPHRFRAGTEVLVHGVDVERVRTSAGARDRTREALGVDRDAPLVCTLANNRAPKDYPNVLAAASLALEAVPDARWIAAGQLVTDEDLGSDHHRRLTLLGHRTDPWDLVGASDVLVVGSRQEGLPVVVMEALALGVPVVSTSVGGIPDLVRDGVEGRLVAPQDPHALGNAVRDLLVDPVERTRMAAAAAARAAEVDVVRAERRLESIYESLVR